MRLIFNKLNQRNILNKVFYCINYVLCKQVSVKLCILISVGRCTSHIQGKAGQAPAYANKQVSKYPWNVKPDKKASLISSFLCSHKYPQRRDVSASAFNHAQNMELKKQFCRSELIIQSRQEAPVVLGNSVMCASGA